MEEEEDEKPHLHLFQNLLTDSCGHGKHRGGAGITVAWLVRGSPEMVYQSIVKSSRIQALQSFFGGYPPPPHPGITVEQSDTLKRMAAGEKHIPQDVYELVQLKALEGKYSVTTNLRAAKSYHEGDIFVGCSHGGVGYGDPIERDPQAVITDLRRKIISAWAARNVYHVVYDTAALVVDEQETDKLRQAVRSLRKKNGSRYQDFLVDWRSKLPPKSSLNYYGDWPEPGSPGKGGSRSS